MIKNEGDILTCSFCGKPQNMVKKIIMGPTANICNECIDECLRIMDHEQPIQPVETQATAAVKQESSLSGPEVKKKNPITFSKLPKPKDIQKYLNQKMPILPLNNHLL